jgi:hypothetical protein
MKKGMAIKGKLSIPLYTFLYNKVISRSWPFKYRSRPGAANKPKNTGKPMIRKNKNTGKNQINI